MEGKLSNISYNAGNRVSSLADKKNKHHQGESRNNDRSGHNPEQKNLKPENVDETPTAIYSKDEISKKIEFINAHKDYCDKRINFEIADEGSSFIVLVKRNGKIIQELLPYQVIDIEKLISKKNDNGEAIKGSLLNIAC